MLKAHLMLVLFGSYFNRRKIYLIYSSQPKDIFEMGSSKLKVTSYNETSAYFCNSCLFFGVF